MTALPSAHDHCWVSAQLWHLSKSQEQDISVRGVQVDDESCFCHFNGMQNHESIRLFMCAHTCTYMTVRVSHDINACHSHQIFSILVLLSMSFLARYRVSESFGSLLARNVPLSLMQVDSSTMYDRIILDLPLHRSPVASFNEDYLV